MSLSKITRAILVAGLLAMGVVVSYSSQPSASAAPPCVVIYRIYYCYQSASGESWYVWNNDKDTAYLRNAEGTLIDTCSYNNKSASSVYC
jgi:hypothetical protein